MPGFRWPDLLCVLVAAWAGLSALPAAGAPQAAAATSAVSSLPSDTPEKFKPNTDSFDYVKREAMIPMRDGVKLRTFILIPKGATDAPMLLTRTPYNAAEVAMNFNSPHLAAVVDQMDDTAVAAGYIIVYQDVRGKYGSEGDYVMTRPLVGPLNPTTVDYATDAYDTIDWLVKHVPESNGRVGTIGGSYAGYTTLMSTVHPHPALKVAVPFAPMVDGWKGDDWFHNGAFRQDGTLDYIYGQEARARAMSNGGPARAIPTRRIWRPARRERWRHRMGWISSASGARSRPIPPTMRSGRTRRSISCSRARALGVPMMIVSGLFDQEDIYGGPAVYAVLAPKDPNGRMIHLVLGPWTHRQARREGRGIGPILFEGDTATWFRHAIMQPFLDYYLKGGPNPDTPRVLAYETGANRWRRYDDWPRACAQGCPAPSRNLYLLPGGKLGFEPASGPGRAGATAGGTAYDEYVSDPAKPVPYRASRPTLLQDLDAAIHLVRMAGRRPAQRRFPARRAGLCETEPLKAPLRVAGAPFAELFASTSGSDSDWVVKIIDVWPDEVPDHPKLGGYQQMLSADIFRGRYREDPATPAAARSGKVLPTGSGCPM
jgi:putative CocE/NonD family hydrolase